MGEISVIIISWNARDHLRNCLNSIRKSGGHLVREVIVVDNASIDGSPGMVAEDFPEVSLFRCNENLGFARGNNIGIQRASGRWLALINSDVVVHPGCFEQLVAVLEKDRQVGLVGPKALGGDGRLQRTCRQLPTLWNTFCRSLALDDAFPQFARLSGGEMRHWEHDSRAEVEVLSGCFCMARQQAVEEVGGLDERFFFYAEDVDWCKRFWEAGWKVVFVPEASITHFGGGSSAAAPLRYSIEMLRANVAYWRKHRGVAGQAVFCVLAVIHHTVRLLMRGAQRVCSGSRSADSAQKCRRSLACLWWLLTGKGV